MPRRLTHAELFPGQERPRGVGVAGKGDAEVLTIRFLPPRKLKFSELFPGKQRPISDAVVEKGDAKVLSIQIQAPIPHRRSIYRAIDRRRNSVHFADQLRDVEATADRMQIISRLMQNALNTAGWSDFYVSVTTLPGQPHAFRVEVKPLEFLL